MSWNIGNPESKELKDKELIAIQDDEGCLFIGKYNKACDWIDLCDDACGIWKLYNIEAWLRLEESPIQEKR